MACMISSIGRKKDLTAAIAATNARRITTGRTRGHDSQRRASATLTTTDGADAGLVTSGGFGPTVDAPVAMGYVPPAVAEIGTSLVAEVRGKSVAVTVAELPFVPARFAR